MPRSERTAAAWAQLAQAAIARELVEGFGLPERQAADRLGIAPSAVSQYLSGKRLGGPMASSGREERTRRIARDAAQDLLAHPESVLAASSRVLEAAIELDRQAGGRPSPRVPAVAGATAEELRRALRARVAGEQAAVADCMRLAQRSRDELTRAIFRQIASDSLRHAEIAASLETYLDRGVHRSVASGITLLDVDRLIAREHAAESTQAGVFPGSLGGIMRLLWESMEADERKHDALLERLRDPEMLGPAPRSGRGTRRRATVGSARG